MTSDESEWDAVGTVVARFREEWGTFDRPTPSVKGSTEVALWNLLTDLENAPDFRAGPDLANLTGRIEALIKHLEGEADSPVHPDPAPPEVVRHYAHRVWEALHNRPWGSDP